MAPRVLSPARLAAAQALLDAERGRHLDQSLVRALDAAQGLSAEDRALAWHLAYGVLRRRGALDVGLAQATRRAVERLDPPVRAALRLGLFELWYGRTPAHAAVDQAVRLAKALRVGHAAGLVNAALRAVGSLPEIPPEVNHPGWLVERRRARLGAEAVARWCTRDDTPAPLALVARDPDLAARFLQAGLTLRPATAGGAPVPGAFWLDEPAPRVEALPGYAEGAFWVMDPAAAAVADLVGARPSELVLDACAAPGGKTLRLAQAGARVTATDLPQRLEAVGANLLRVGLEAQVLAVDWLGSEAPAGVYDAVLVDAPCTGLGTTRRHPEIRWGRQPGDLAACAVQQRRLLERLAGRVTPGGRLVYAVCSPEPEEGLVRVQGFLEQHPEFVLEQTLSLDPPSEDEDAHWAARLRRLPSPLS